MTSNPLKARRESDPDGWIGEAPRWSVEDMHQWCAEHNRLAQDVGWNIWYRVVPEQLGAKRIHKIEMLEGYRAEEARRRARNEPIEYLQLAPGEAEEIQREIAALIAKGVTPDEFRRMNRRRLL